MIHGIVGTGYAYWLTTTAMIEWRGESRRLKDFNFLQSEPTTVRRINE